MADFVQLWVYLASTPLFGLTATLATYVLAQAVYEYTGRAPWANPVLWSVVCIGCVLLVTGTPLPHLFRRRAVCARAAGAGRGGTGLAAVAAPRRGAQTGPGAGAGGAGRRHGGGRQRVDAGLGTGPAARGAALAGAQVGDGAGGHGHCRAHRWRAGAGGGVRGGDRPGGALSGRYLFNLLGIRSWAVRGFALGTASHGIGAARALQVHPDAGAYAGMALGLQVLLAALLMPLAFRWLGL